MAEPATFWFGWWECSILISTSISSTDKVGWFFLVICHSCSLPSASGTVLPLPCRRPSALLGFVRAFQLEEKTVETALLGKIQ